MKDITNLDYGEELTNDRDDAHLKKMPKTFSPSSTGYTLASHDSRDRNAATGIAACRNGISATTYTQCCETLPGGWKLTSGSWIKSSMVTSRSTTQCKVDMFVTCPRRYADTTVTADFIDSDAPHEDLVRFMKQSMLRKENFRMAASQTVLVGGWTDNNLPEGCMKFSTAHEAIPAAEDGGTEGDNNLPEGWMQFNTTHEAISATEDAGTESDNNLPEGWMLFSHISYTSGEFLHMGRVVPLNQNLRSHIHLQELDIEDGDHKLCQGYQRW